MGQAGTRLVASTVELAGTRLEGLAGTSLVGRPTGR